jgi:excisionase family DNA binding protein
MGLPAEQLPPPDAAPVAELLTVEELAALLRVERKTAYALVRDGKVPGVHRFGRAIRIHRGSVVAWLAGQSGDPPRRTRRA